MTAPRHPAQPRDTKREDRRAWLAAGKRYNAAKLQWLYGARSVGEQEFNEAKSAFLHASEVYVVGRRKASVEFGLKHGAKSKGGK